MKILHGTLKVQLVLDKLSILCLKIFHMKEQTKRGDVTKGHIEICHIN